MDDSRKSSGSESCDSSSSDLSSDEDQLPAKKPFLSYCDPDERASSSCPPLSIASTEGTTVLRRSLRKIIEESKKDAASSSVSNSRESTPPRMFGLRGRVSSRQVFSPASTSQPSRLSKNNSGGVYEVTRSSKHVDFLRRSARTRRTRCVVDDSATKSLPDSTALSSDDDASSVKESRKVFNSVSNLKKLTKSSHLATLIDTSDTDSRASSLCAYSTGSTATGQISVVESNGHGSASAKQKTGKRSNRFTRGRDKLSEMHSSDSETDSQINAFRTSYFDSFLDNSSSGSSIVSSVHNAELSTDHYIDNCKYGVGTCSEAEEMPAMKVDLDEVELKNSAEINTNKEKHRKSELKAELPLSASKESVQAEKPGIKKCLEHKHTHYQNENGETNESSDSASDVLMQKGQSLGENISAVSTNGDNTVTETKEEEKDALLKINCNNLEASEEDMKIKENVKTDEEAQVADQTEDEETKADGCSKPVANDGSAEEDLNEKFQEDDEMLNVKEEPPEILVNVTCTVVWQ